MTGPSATAGLPDGVDVLTLVRRFEPVLRFTQGEMFFPLPVGDYVAGASLWRSDPDGGTPPVLVAGHGELTPDALARHALQNPSAALFMRYAPRSLDRRELRIWRRRPEHPKFSGVSRLAAVGLLGRFIDSGMRLSLTLRGKVPGGLTAAAQQQYVAISTPRDAYHAHVSTDGGYVVIQYWFLYAMNDWRSSFSGVNDHESDWEQVTMYLVPTEVNGKPETADERSREEPGVRSVDERSREEPGVRSVDDYRVAWVAFSAHDEVGDDLRRRADDPDISWVFGTHPVVNAGAGSHSGAYLPGDYLVRIQPPAMERFLGTVNKIRGVLFPWTRHRPSLGVGIPYVDYRRGDGERIGPGTDRPWTPVLIDDDVPWVRDYRGLWGLDTSDPFGGERAPAGPRYERSGVIRASWGDPVGWAGLDKVPPSDPALGEAALGRVEDLDKLVADLDSQIADGQEELRRAARGTDLLPSSATGSRRGGDGAAARLVAQEQAVAVLRTRRRDAINERDQLRQVRTELLDRPPHAHLRRRAVPDTTTSTGVLLRFWSGASMSILLAIMGVALLAQLGSIFVVTAAAVVLVMGVEALLRRKFGLFLLGLAITFAIAGLIWLLFTHVRVALGILTLTAAIAIGVANLRALLSRR